MWYWLRTWADGRASVLAQRAASEGPRWTRAMEAHPSAPFTVTESGGRGKARSPFISTIVCGVLILSLLSGCALFAPREEGQLKQATVKELTALLIQREAAIQTMKGLFSAKVRGGIIPIASRLEGALYYRRPNAMRLRGFTAVGSELFEFVQANDHFRLRLPTMGRVLSGNPSDMSEMGHERNGKACEAISIECMGDGWRVGDRHDRERRDSRASGRGGSLPA